MPGALSPSISLCINFVLLEWNPVVYDIMMAEPGAVVVEPWSLPMLVPPRPWKRYNNGGYLLHTVNCVRLQVLSFCFLIINCVYLWLCFQNNHKVSFGRLQQLDASGRLNSTLQGLTVLGSTPWKINDPILRVALHLQQNGEMGVNGSPTAYDERNGFPDFPPLDLDNGKMEASSAEVEAFRSPSEYAAHLSELERERDAASLEHSSASTTTYMMEIARQFSGLIFYLPHSVDFRGRAYPIPPYLSHLGNDLARGMQVDLY